MIDRPHRDKFLNIRRWWVFVISTGPARYPDGRPVIFFPYPFGER